MRFSDDSAAFTLTWRSAPAYITVTSPLHYRYIQVDLVVGSNDMVHVQWTGNDDTNNNGNNNGEGTNSEDRHNIVRLHICIYIYV